jgi:hypothetical protein
MGRDERAGVNGEMTLWLSFMEKGDGSEEEETVKLLPGSDRTVLLQINKKHEGFITPWHMSDEQRYEIGAEKLVELIKQHGVPRG